MFELEAKWILSLGNKFALPVDSRSFAPIPLIADIEQWVQNIMEETEKEQARARIATRISNYKRNIKNSEKEKFILYSYEEAKRFLKKHENTIIVTTADKGNKTVVMYKDEYRKKMKELLNDKKTYKIIEADPTEKLINKNNNIITELYKNKFITKFEKIKLTAYTGNAPQLYGLPKTHKHNLPMRPISASCNVPCFELSKFIGVILKNLVSLEYNIPNSIELKRKLEDVIIDRDEIMISFDVVSLFTNIPIHLAIKNIMDQWHKLKDYTAIDKRTFLKILQFCLNENNYFNFDDKIYQQQYGMPMGNPLSPTIANIILDTLLDDAIKELNAKNIQIKFLTKYVDDLFAVIKKADEEIILDTLNAYHNKIKFTVEKEKDGTLPYLDMMIINDNSKIITNWYAKPTSSGRMINFYSTQPLQMKLNTGKSFIKKVVQLSHKNYLQQNLEKIRNILSMNNYPSYITNDLIDKVLKNDANRNTCQEEKEKRNFYSVPYIPRLTETKSLKGIIKDKTTTIAHKSNKTTRHLFNKNKSKLDKLKQNNVVYEIKCNGNEKERCDLVYIGTTKRILGKRIKEHRTDVMKGKEATALCLHAKECNHNMDFENIKILDKEKNENKRYTLESLRIQQKLERTMNTKEDKDNTKLQYSSVVV